MPKIIIVAIVIAGIGGFLAIIFYYATFFNSGNWFSFVADLEQWGQTGDFFGGILNPFFTFIGLILVIITIKQNQTALAQSESELALTRDELKKSNETLKQQAISQEMQRFESTFFALLDQHNQLVNKITSKPPRTNTWESYSIINNLLESINKSSSKENKLKNYKIQLLNFDNPIINQYFRVLYQILKFIASNCPSSTMREHFIKGNISPAYSRNQKCSPEEKLYSNIVRSFLTNEIYGLLAINCYCSRDDDPFWTYKILIERYSFLEHMSLEDNRHKGQQKSLKNEAIKEIVIYYKDTDVFGNKPSTEIQKILS